MRLQLSQMAVHFAAFLDAPFTDGAGEAWIGDQVPAAHDAGKEAARNLVPALGAGFEAGQAFAQALVDALVVAGLEVQAGMEFGRTPVAAVKRVAATQTQGTGDRGTVALGQHDD